MVVPNFRADFVTGLVLQRVLSSLCKNIFLILIFLLFNMYIFCCLFTYLERERQMERETENPKRAPHCPRGV